MTGIVRVSLWGTCVGYLGYAPGQTETASFEFDEAFARSGIQLSPIVMRCPPRLHSFPDISSWTFKGLPGIFADSLPDSFGEKLIDLYMAERGVPNGRITALDRLLYVGKRGMGGFEYEPSREFEDGEGPDLALDVRSLGEIAGMVAARDDARRRALLDSGAARDAIRLIRVGSSAGGARAKALVSRRDDGTFVDGTLAGEGSDAGSIAGTNTGALSHWLLKFDVGSNADRDGMDPKGMTRVEYVYSIIARECGIDMPETDGIEDGDDFHFLVRRFDRETEGAKTRKLHYSSWAALSHADRDATGSHSYEELVLLARNLGLGQDAVTEIFRRAAFNVVGRNQDDHTKNFAFLMDRAGSWKLSPAFDLTWSFDPAGRWTRVHQIRLNGKQDYFTRDDLLAFGRYCNLDAKKAGRLLDASLDAFSAFPRLAAQYGVPEPLSHRIRETQRLYLT
ncbi:MAG TPA: type II toxin-antitoxin system HipA family toxin [Treponemataceae bacterium]|nr:type II toxin-antitoxin system HipA family toxin [Treponemataceae bacterium]